MTAPTSTTMNFTFSISRLAALLAALACAKSARAQPAVAEAPRFSRFVVFGDSLSDTGNSARRVQEAVGVRFPSPAFNYADGRFTNGPGTTPASARYVGMWHEQLARAVGLAPARASAEGGYDFSFAGATTQDGVGKRAFGSPIVNPPITLDIDNMGLQAAAYLRRGTPDPNALAILWGGTNDLLRDHTPAAVAGAAERIGALVKKLGRAGARAFLVVNVPPLGDSPLAARGPDPGALSRAAAQFRNALSTALDQAQAGLSQENRPVRIYRLDAFDLFSRARRDPGAYGFANTSQSAQGRAVDPDGYVFWDSLHFTTSAHHQVALAAQALLEGSPAPRPTLSLSLSRPAVGESAGANAATLTITRTGPTSGALSIALSSSDPGEARVPTAVTIPVGARSATVAILAVDDLLADGTQRVSILARAASLASVSASLSVLDNAAAALSLKITSSRIREGGARATLTITRNSELTAASRALPVALGASLPAQITLPPGVTIPARAASVSVPIAAVDDVLPDGPRRVVITARASGFVGASQAVTVEDNEAAPR